MKSPFRSWPCGKKALLADVRFDQFELSVSTNRNDSCGSIGCPCDDRFGIVRGGCRLPISGLSSPDDHSRSSTRRCDHQQGRQWGFMRTLVRTLVAISGVAAAAGSLNGCSNRLKIELFDATGQSLAVESGRDHSSLSNLRSTTLAYPGPDEGWRISLRAGDCEYIYQMPQSLDHYVRPAGYYGPLKVQVDAEFVMYLLPTSAEAVQERISLSSTQVDGFPLSPSKKNCGGLLDSPLPRTSAEKRS